MNATVITTQTCHSKEIFQANKGRVHNWALNLLYIVLLQAKKLIEIIRGPGSTLYGENAFTTAINIITFDAKDVDSVWVSGGYGSFDL